ncbi:hypothetical protein ERJ75_000159300 [Trypanosoma vivax]|uniref:Uncharacterized protein n=1 Tax=Trypanosoma vivax (strain Y486) TaxID=1055687 RepID=F9WS63_TRYVY|nr:hypothetical protein ERJ75_000159300 [Trypanosoma vivax]CCD20401.1 hypothetical protein, conserved in T. vivax [Trypanosoma vivax Y486]|eukprot:CCD20401.1 hypothetical protein, conserved in T. vivax [Trypanosoma vivax Y486]
MAKLVIQLCLLVLPFTVLPIVAALPSSKAACPTTRDGASDTQKCTTKDLIWGWLHVVNKIYERLSEVRKNATEIAKGVVELRKEANTALANATKLLNELDSNHEEYRRAKEVMKNISDATAWADESERNATEAADAANITEDFIRDGYGAISLVVWYFRGGNYVQELKYDALSAKIGEIAISKENACARVHSVSGVLIDHAEKLHDEKTSLTEWKTGMLEAIKTTYNDTQSNKTTCLGVFNDHEKVGQVTAAVGKLSEQLIVKVKHLNAALQQREKARENIAAANNDMNTMTTNMLNSLKKNGAGLCGMVRRHEAVLSKLDETKRLLDEVSKRVSSTSSTAAGIERNTAATNKLAQEALKKVDSWYKSIYFFDSTESPSSRSIIAATKALKNSREASERVMHLCGEASLRVKFAEDEINSIYQKLKDVGNDLKQRLEEINIGVEDVSASECNNKLSKLLTGTHTDALRFATRLNVNEMLKAKKTLAGLEALGEKINKNVSFISENLETITKSSENASKLERSAAAAAEVVVINFLSHLMSNLCATTNKLRVLQSNLMLLSADARTMKKSISDEKANAIAALKNVSGSPSMSPYVEAGFTFAGRMAVLLDRELEHSKKQLEKVAADYVAANLGNVDDEKSAYDAVRDAVAEVFAGTHRKPSTDVCAGNATSKLVQELKGKGSSFSLLRDASDIIKLGYFATKMNGEVASAVKRINKAVMRAAEANKALVEAIRRAREEVAGRRCPPLYLQLLNVLSGRL